MDASMVIAALYLNGKAKLRSLTLQSPLRCIRVLMTFGQQSVFQKTIKWLRFLKFLKNLKSQTFNYTKFVKGDDGVVVCKSDGTIDQRYNPGAYPKLLDSSKPSIGISDPVVKRSDGWLICSFKRLKQLNNVTHYFDLNNKYFILGAYGEMYHGKI